MRPLIVHSGNMYGGVERVLETVADARQIYPALNPHFALCFEGSLAASLRQRSAALTILGDVRATRPHLVMRARRRLAAALKDHPADVVVAPSCWSLALFAPVARRARLPVILWLHDALSGKPWLEKLARRHAPDLVICNSRFTEHSARDLFAASPSEVIYCPLTFGESSTTRQHVRQQLRTADDGRVIVTVARLERYKGHDVLIDALALLPKNLPWTCWVVGGAQRETEREYLRDLQRRAAERGVADRVQWLGQRGDVPDLLGAADVLCHPNRGAEPFGLAIVEALHAGLPVVASALGGPSEIVNDSCGALVQPGDARALASALLPLLSDRQRRDRLGRAGPARATDLCDPRARLADLAAAFGRVVVKAAA